MKAHNGIRVLLAWTLGIVAGTAIAGGVALVLGSLVPAWSTVLVPPTDFLGGSPFSNYLVPGLLLGVGVGGLHLVAFILVLKRHRLAALFATICGFEMLIWIFVEMSIIPFSGLQVVFEAIGLLEIGLVLLILDLIPRQRTLRARSAGIRGGQ